MKKSTIGVWAYLVIGTALAIYLSNDHRIRCGDTLPSLQMAAIIVAWGVVVPAAGLLVVLNIKPAEAGCG